VSWTMAAAVWMLMGPMPVTPMPVTSMLVTGSA
jgi:hypothetical protein